MILSLSFACIYALILPTFANTDPEKQHYCEFLRNERYENPLLVLWAMMQPSWQTLPAQGCSATVNEKWSSHPSWSKRACEAHWFLAECQKWVCKKKKKSYSGRSQWGRNGWNEFFTIINQFQLCTLCTAGHASGANNSPASELMTTSSPGG